MALDPDGFDGAVQDFAKQAGFQASGVDALQASEQGRRTDARAGYRFFTRLASGTLSNDRRRLVILNGVTDSSSHAPWEILVNQDYYRTANDSDAVRAAINAVKPAPDSNKQSVSPFEQWALDHAAEGLDNDPDGDGLSNQQEFAFGTNPSQFNSEARARLRLLRQVDGHYQIRYPRATRASSIRSVLMVSTNLVDWEPHQAPQRAVIPVDDASEDVVVALREDSPRAYYRLDLIED